MYRFGVPFTPTTHPFISTMTDPTKKPSNPKDLIGSTKPGISAIPLPVLYMLGAAMTEGTKYGRHNYRVVGVRASVYFDAAFRHMADYWEGQTTDPDSGLPHLAKAMACFAIILDADENEMLTDDRPPAMKKGWMKRAQARTTQVLANIKGKVLPPYTQAKITFDDDFEFHEG
jgi:hypothetical protein